MDINCISFTFDIFDVLCLNLTTSGQFFPLAKYPKLKADFQNLLQGADFSSDPKLDSVKKCFDEVVTPHLVPSVSITPASFSALPHNLSYFIHEFLSPQKRFDGPLASEGSF